MAEELSSWKMSREKIKEADVITLGPGSLYTVYFRRSELTALQRNLRHRENRLFI